MKRPGSTKSRSPGLRRRDDLADGRSEVGGRRRDVEVAARRSFGGRTHIGHRVPAADVEVFEGPAALALDQVHQVQRFLDGEAVGLRAHDL
jgi:hypothetical protein